MTVAGNDKTCERVALITGAGGGIGGCVAHRLAPGVTTLVINGRNEAKLAALASSLAEQFPGLEIEQALFDVSDPLQVEQSMRELFKKHKRLDLLINCAGTLAESPLMFTSPDQIRQLFEINTFGSLYSAQQASRLMMRGNGGVIINIGSVVAEQGSGGQAAYSASKAALDGVTRSLAKELGPYNIRVNTVAPGFIDTEMVAHYSKEQRAALKEKTALGRLGTPEDVSALVAFLCSDKASYITGQTLSVDGMLQL